MTYSEEQELLELTRLNNELLRAILHSQNNRRIGV